MRRLKRQYPHWQPMSTRRRVEFDGSYRIRNKTERAIGNTYTTGTGLTIKWVHPPAWCEDREFCVIHRPSDHIMRSFPTHWRMDRHIMERICPHGVGHPDPDDQSYLRSVGLMHGSVHGCDGCCRPPHEEDCAKVQGYPDDCNCARSHSAE